MTLTPGTRLGPYEIVAPIGAGGMGEVFRARDTKLDRDVAIKVLPESFAADADRVARFTREAKTLASLNHPNIAAIYGIEDNAIVMELVEGEDLSEVIARRPEGPHQRPGLGLDVALPIAKQIADALEAAHEQGIVHRDLKPQNIKVRADGTVKVLDFGLAKAMDPASASSDAAMNSPTMTARATQMGMIIGTAAYMSPEQARGRAVDRRADIWAFGAVLYEMLAGQRAFEGEDISVTLANVIKETPNWNALPAHLPSSIRRLLVRCLEKDPKKRLSAIADARFDLDDTATTTVDSGTPVPRDRRWLPWAAGASLGMAATALLFWAFHTVTPTTAATPMRFAFVEAKLAPRGTQDRVFAISPDGTRIAYVTNDGLYVRPIDQLQATQIQSVSPGARAPFFSPDGKWIGYFNGRIELRKVAVTGGPSLLVCPIGGPPRGGLWVGDTIIFAAFKPGGAPTGLLAVPAAGGEPKAISHVDPTKGEGGHQFPSRLPGGAILFTVVTPGGAIRSPEDDYVAALDPRTGAITQLVRGADQAEYVAPPSGSEAGFLVYAVGASLRAVAFDPTRLATTGEPVEVAQRVAMTPSGAAQFAVSQTGLLVYVDGGIDDSELRRGVAWVDREGHTTPIGVALAPYRTLRLSPDNAKLVLDMNQNRPSIRIWDLARQTMTPLTLDPVVHSLPLWSPDGRRIAFSSRLPTSIETHWQLADGTAPADRLLSSPRESPQFPMSFTPEGASMLVSADNGSVMRLDLKTAALTTVLPAVTGSSAQLRNAEVSPDGKWLAYESTEAQLPQIYVRPFPDVNAGRWQMSRDGGTKPGWAPNSRELFFVDGNRASGVLMSVAMPDGPSHASSPVQLFALWNNAVSQERGRQYDVTRDGRRFVAITSPPILESTPNTIVVVVNWFEELRAKVAAKK